ncbi:MAG: 23S rRNA (adenine(2503)-C(2))-methyltransferase RlmN [Pseudomonadota bacterium]|nr:MAG: 23S rRNA (adenine(2503)-C(2))-methyltransferase RlmN [Pseudomonadota bacterium]
MTAAPSEKDLAPLGRFPEEWEAVLAELGEPRYRAKQIFRWVHRRGVFDPRSMSDVPEALRRKLGELGLRAPVEVLSVHRSSDGTRKLVLGLLGGARVECVLIPMTRLEDADAAAVVEDEDESGQEPVSHPVRRVTLCVSTQYGCAMGCRFCASGRAGLRRGLEAHEIVAQVLVARAYLEPGEELRNLVFMGMGEPLHHYDRTARALCLLLHQEGQNFSPRRITVSTVGLVPGIQKLGRDFQGKIGLAISLHAPNDAIRSRLLPMNDRYPIAELMKALREYPLPRRRRITIEYTLIAGVNDAPEHARELGRLLSRIPVKINLIPMNRVDGTDFEAPSSEAVARFQSTLTGLGFSCFVRTRRGDEVDAACGQLAMRPDLVKLGTARPE